jgi:hypothetical protein
MFIWVSQIILYHLGPEDASVQEPNEVFVFSNFSLNGIQELGPYLQNRNRDLLNEWLAEEVP